MNHFCILWRYTNIITISLLGSCHLSLTVQSYDRQLINIYVLTNETTVIGVYSVLELKDV